MGAGLPHDLRNLLAIAETSVYLAKRKLSGGTPHPELEDRDAAVAAELEKTAKALRSAQELLTATLAFARGERPRAEERRVSDLLDDALKHVCPESRRRIAVDVVPADLAVSASPCLVTAALANLVKNAVEASERGAIRVRARRDGEKVCVSVEDEGPGFPSGASVSTALSSTKAGGCGLGLRAARATALAHGGDLKVERPEQGARVTIELPATRI